MPIYSPDAVAVGYSLRLPRVPVSAYDPDAAAYFARSANITDKANINAFIVGAKALGAWTNAVYWAARSGQNAGTGTTMYAFGGLTSMDATLVNGPTWAANGLQRPSGLAAYATFPTIDTSTPDACSLFAVYKLAAYPNGSQFVPIAIGNGGVDDLISHERLAVYTDNVNHEPYVRCADMTGGDNIRSRGLLNGSVDVRDGAFHAHLGSVGSAASFARVLQMDNGEVGVDSGTGTARHAVPDSGILMATQGGVTTFDATLAFACVSTEAFSALGLFDLYALYRDTIGQGLSLP